MWLLEYFCVEWKVEPPASRRGSSIRDSDQVWREGWQGRTTAEAATQSSKKSSAEEKTLESFSERLSGEVWTAVGESSFTWGWFSRLFLIFPNLEIIILIMELKANENKKIMLVYGVSLQIYVRESNLRSHQY